MDTKMIEKLKKAGVAPDVILELILDDIKEQPADVQTTPEEVKTPGPPAEEQAAAPEAAPEAVKASAETDSVLAKLDRLIGIVQQRNILLDGRDSAPKESVDEILAAMITPQKKEG